VLISDENIREKLKDYKSTDFVKIQCDQCKNEYKRKKRDILCALRRNRTKGFCSKECNIKNNDTSIITSCKNCNKEVRRLKNQFEKSKNHFCNRSCSVSYNNKISPKRKKTIKEPVYKIPKIKQKVYCDHCSLDISHKYNKRFCSIRCSQSHIRLEKIASGKFSAKVGKRHLLDTLGQVCSVCNLSEWMGKVIPIELDHIDGNHENNSLDNLRLLCPNCHAQTETYKGKNKGNGRAYRMKRYHSGKSY